MVKTTYILERGEYMDHRTHCISVLLHSLLLNSTIKYIAKRMAAMDVVCSEQAYGRQ